MLVVPLTRWFLGMSAGTEDLQTKLMVQTIAKDKWDEIHAETFDDLAAALAANPSPWTEYIGDGNRWKIETTIGGEGKYVNAACADGTAGATDRKCRKVSIQVTDTMTGMTQAVNLAKVDSEYFNSRMKALETKAANLDTKVAAAQSTADTAKANAATAQSTANTANSNANSALSKFGEYYDKAEVDSKLSNSASFVRFYTSGGDPYYMNYVFYTGKTCNNGRPVSSYYGYGAWGCSGGKETITISVGFSASGMNGY